MTRAVELLVSLTQAALAEGASVLTEPEVYRVLKVAGLPVPEHVVLPLPSSAHLTDAPIPGLPTGQVVLKVVSRDILHKSDVGGVRFLDAQEVTPRLVSAFVEDTSKAWSDAHGRRPSIRGALVMKRVAFDSARPGSEVLVGLRFSRDFGFVALIGLGGLKAELFGSRLPRREAAALFSPTTAAAAMRELRHTLVYRDLAGQLRGSARAVEDATWERLLTFLCEVAQVLTPVGVEGAPALEELEFNPFLVDGTGHLVAVDALARVRPATAAPARPPVHKLRALFEPKSICVAGVSSKGVNMGRIILRNLLRDGFAPGQLVVLKPGEEEIDGVRCVPSPSEFGGRVDLAVLAVAAAAVPAMVDGLVQTQRAEAILIIPGGMAEKEGGAGTQQAVEATLRQSRATPWGGPVVCGPNSMGVRSTPGHCDTTFIPEDRLPPQRGRVRNLAFISQSGAFTIARGSHLEQLVPRYLVSAGNQMDVSVSDFLTYVAEDPEVQVIAAYVEGFTPGDGRAFLRAAEAAHRAGKRVVLYKGGRSPEGQGTAAGHTAAIAGDYRACWHLARAAGVLVAESFSDFEGLLRVATTLAGRQGRGRRVGLMSNAGFEIVGMADHLRGETHTLELAALGPPTRERIHAVLSRHKLDGLVDVKNPLDVTPSASDVAHVEMARALLDDDGVDALVLGVVPMSPALASLGTSADERETLASPESLARTLPRLFAATKKPLVAVVDGGRLYQPLVAGLEEGGMPVFHRADDAVRALGAWLCGSPLCPQDA